MINFQTTYIYRCGIDAYLYAHTKGDVQSNDSTVVASVIENNLSRSLTQCTKIESKENAVYLFAFD